MILGLSLLYCMFVLYLVFLPLDEARKVFQAIDPKLGVDLPERSYADDC